MAVNVKLTPRACSLSLISPRHMSLTIIVIMVIVLIEVIPTLIVSVSIVAAESSTGPTSATSLLYTTGSLFRNTDYAYTYEVTSHAAIVTNGICTANISTTPGTKTPLRSSIKTTTTGSSVYIIGFLLVFSVSVLTLVSMAIVFRVLAEFEFCGDSIDNFQFLSL